MNSNQSLDNQAGLPGLTLDTLKERLVSLFAKELNEPPENIDVSRPLTEFGLDSVGATIMIGELEDWLRIEQLPDTFMWDYQTVAEIADYLFEQVTNKQLNFSH